MTYNEVPTRLAELYLYLLQLMYLHPIRADAFVFAAVFMIIMYVLRDHSRRRHKLYRLLWGTYMRRADRVRYHMKGFEDSIVDYAMEAVHRGDMSEAEEIVYFNFFAERCEMAGLKPASDPKRGIRARLRALYNTKPNIPGGPTEVKRDPTYDGSKVEGLLSSKYLKPPT